MNLQKQNKTIEMLQRFIVNIDSQRQFGKNGARLRHNIYNQLGRHLKSVTEGNHG